ncbi:MAG: hypothetical protein JO218_19940 [Burkholderiales bacterium]|nr:hypothetical protein [Burkholderiales bacterium]
MKRKQLINSVGVLVLASGLLSGCAVVAVADAAVSVTTTAVGVAVDGVELAGKGAYKAGKAVVNAASPSSTPKPDTPAAQSDNH